MTEEWVQPELPFEQGAPTAGGIDLKEYVGCACIIAVGGCHPEMGTRFGVKPAVRGGLILLNGPDAYKEFDDVLFFATRVVRNLRGLTGQARVWHIDVDNSTTQPAVELLEPSPDEFELARKWHEENPTRTRELIAEMQAAFNAASAGVTVREQPRQQPARTPPPTGPHFGKSGPPPPSSPPLAKDRPSYNPHDEIPF